MKKFSIYTIIPALSLLAVGCSGPGSMQSSEYDDMYYSSADRTEYVQPADETYAAQQNQGAEQEAVQSQEYAARSSDITSNYYADEDYDYYDGREYNPRDNWYRPNYSFVDPYWGQDVYTSSYYHHPRSYRYRYADPFYDPFYYDPFFYDPYGYRPYWGSGLSISISYNYGWGGYYNRWNPYYGYGRYYNPWSPYYGGYYGGYYGRQYVYDYPGYAPLRKVQYGPRDSRGGTVTERTRTERGNLNESREQRAVYGRPSRATERVNRSTTEEGKEVITTRPGRDASRPRDTGTTRQRVERSSQPQEQRTQPARQQEQRVQPARQQEQRRTTRESTSTPQRREYRQEQRSTESRPAPTRTYEQRETRRSEPARSSGSSGSSSGGGSGRPPRGN
ncbi:hypothetical protein [Pontibacter burrus]|uniref:Uncharacterized protein n=1 Tax=Pontibacter burrus TaxID=2704466 RepID=A0A6B3LI16_9BACT|nr:hypothetical protein [Pontibacter burrus]NEM96239.1 hypothetical protein [Pontibacter burrus]